MPDRTGGPNQDTPDAGEGRIEAGAERNESEHHGRRITPEQDAAVRELAAIETVAKAHGDLSPYAKEDCTSCWGRGWNRQIMCGQVYHKMCNCVMRRVRKLKEKAVRF